MATFGGLLSTGGGLRGLAIAAGASVFRMLRSSTGAGIYLNFEEKT